jgi:hypothetical protein
MKWLGRCAAEKMRWTHHPIHNIPLWMPRAQGAGDAAYDSEIDSLLDSAPGMSDEGAAFPSTSEQTSAPKSYKVTLAQNAAGISVYSIVYSAVLANNAAQRLIRLVLWVLVSWAASPLRLIWSTASGVAARCSSACFEQAPRETARCDERSELQILSQQNRQRLLERDGMLHQPRQPLSDTLSLSPVVDQYSTPQEASSHRTRRDLSAGSHVDTETDTSSACLEGLSDLSQATSSPHNLQYLRCQVVNGGVASLATAAPLASRVTKVLPLSVCVLVCVCASASVLMCETISLLVSLVCACARACVQESGAEPHTTTSSHIYIHTHSQRERERESVREICKEVVGGCKRARIRACTRPPAFPSLNIHANAHAKKRKGSVNDKDGDVADKDADVSA